MKGCVTQGKAGILGRSVNAVDGCDKMLRTSTARRTSFDSYKCAKRAWLLRRANCPRQYGGGLSTTN